MRAEPINAKRKPAAVAASAQLAVDKKEPRRAAVEEELPSPKGKGKCAKQDRTAQKKKKQLSRTATREPIQKRSRTTERKGTKSDSDTDKTNNVKEKRGESTVADVPGSSAVTYGQAPSAVTGGCNIGATAVATVLPTLIRVKQEACLDDSGERTPAAEAASHGDRKKRDLDCLEGKDPAAKQTQLSEEAYLDI